MEENKFALSYTHRYTINYYRKTVIAMLLQQCRISKVSNSVMALLSTLLEYVMVHCVRSIRSSNGGCIFAQFESILTNFSKTFMSTTPREFTLQQFIDYLISHNRLGASENLPLVFGQRNSNGSGPLPINPQSNIEVVDS